MVRCVLGPAAYQFCTLHQENSSHTRIKLPSYSLKARQEAPSSNNGNGCDCLSGGAIAGIVIGSIAGFFLLYWLLKLAFDSTNTSETVTYRTGRYDHPSRHRRRSSSYVETERPVSTRRYRRDVIERPAKVYVS
ncbi:hypothetical protein DIZ76_013179 [Coccidioides immitis]|nr:hypothetical protein DIZ76_013179 [Coccidioides immitis]